MFSAMLQYSAALQARHHFGLNLLRYIISDIVIVDMHATDYCIVVMLRCLDTLISAYRLSAATSAHNYYLTHDP